MPVPLMSTTSYGWSTRAIVKFGGMPWPKFGSTMTYMDLNDGNYWCVDDGIDISGSHIKNVAAQKTWLQSGVWMSQDFVGRTIKLPVMYDENGNGQGSKPLSQALAYLSQAGEQYITFDNATGLLCRFNGYSERPVKSWDPVSGSLVWSLTLQFQARSPWWQDFSATTTALGNMAMASGGGANTGFSIAYTGDVGASPVFTLTIPSACTYTTSSLLLANLTSGETHSTALNLAGSTNHTVVLDMGNFVDTADGSILPAVGSWPQLYPAPPGSGSSNAWSMTIIGTGSYASLPLSVTYTNQWEG